MNHLLTKISKLFTILYLLAWDPTTIFGCSDTLCSKFSIQLYLFRKILVRLVAFLSSLPCVSSPISRLWYWNISPVSCESSCSLLWFCSNSRFLYLVTILNTLKFSVNITILLTYISLNSSKKGYDRFFLII